MHSTTPTASKKRANDPPVRFVDWDYAQRLTSKSRTTLWRWIQTGDFPRPRMVGPNSSMFIESELLEWHARKAAG